MKLAPRPSEGNRKEFEDHCQALKAKLKDVFEEFGIDAAVMGFSFPSVQHDEVSPDPSTHLSTVFVTAMHTEIIEELFKSDVPVQERSLNDAAKIFVGLIHYSRIMTHLIESYTQEREEILTAMQVYGKRIGISGSQMFAIKPGEVYEVQTSEDETFEIFYDENVNFTIRCINKELVIPERLKFIGNIEASGMVFNTSELPIFSTGDRLLFGTVKDLQLHPSFVTGPVISVMEKSKIN